MIFLRKADSKLRTHKSRTASDQDVQVSGSIWKHAHLSLLRQNCEHAKKDCKWNEMPEKQAESHREDKRIAGKNDMENVQKGPTLAAGFERVGMQRAA